MVFKHFLVAVKSTTNNSKNPFNDPLQKIPLPPDVILTLKMLIERCKWPFKGNDQLETRGLGGWQTKSITIVSDHGDRCPFVF
jgi:hypothetical protein